jgi:hypothetical protein
MRGWRASSLRRRPGEKETAARDEEAHRRDLKAEYPVLNLSEIANT